MTPPTVSSRACPTPATVSSTTSVTWSTASLDRAAAGDAVDDAVDASGGALHRLIEGVGGRRRRCRRARRWSARRSRRPAGRPSASTPPPPPPASSAAGLLGRGAALLLGLLARGGRVRVRGVDGAGLAAALTRSGGGVRCAGASPRRSCLGAARRVALAAFEPFSPVVTAAPGGLRPLGRAGRAGAPRSRGDGLGRGGRGPDLGGPVGGRRGRRDLVDAGAGADPGDEDRGAGGGLPPTARTGDRRTSAAARRRRRRAARNFTNAGNGSSPATREATRSRTDGRVSSSRSSPAASASRRQPWQCERWRASRRVSRVPSRDCAGGDDDALDALAAGAGDDVVVLLGQPPAGAEERRLDGRAAHAHALADLLVAEALELAQDEDLVVGLAQPAERAAEVVEVLLGGDGGVGRRAGADQLGVIAGRERVVGVVGDLLGALGAAEGVDAAVLGDLVQPGLEGQRLLGLAHPAQRGDEDLLGDVLGAAVVLDHAEHVGVDAALVALVEELEGAVVTAPDRRDQSLVGVRGLTRIPGRCRRGTARSPTHCF